MIREREANEKAYLMVSDHRRRNWAIVTKQECECDLLVINLLLIS